MRTPPTRPIALLLALAAAALSPADPTFTTATFSTGNEGWQPDNWQTTDVGGLAPGNPYLRIAADGSGALGKMVLFNQEPEWTGDYYSAGVTGIELDIVNRSDSDIVYLRIALGNRANPQQSGGTWFLTDAAVVVPTLSEWTHVHLGLAESDVHVVGNLMGEVGSDSYAETFGAIQGIRILSKALPFGAIGDEFVGMVGIDNVVLVPEPSTLPLIALGTGLLALRRRRASGRPATRRNRCIDALLSRDR